MRIVAGQWKGRRITAPPGKLVRPTLDRVREAWMSILQMDIPGARVLDLYAGSGALGLEALSRGAVSADFVENASRSLAALEANIEALGAGERARVHRTQSLRFVKTLAPDAFDLTFADPPYEEGEAKKLAEVWIKTRFSAILSVEHATGSAMPEGGDTRRYGTASITIYRSAE
jgi:16S rRNA (guanine966-N2)-methyltransferase